MSERDRTIARAADVLMTAGVAHAQLRRHYAETLYEADLLRPQGTRAELVDYYSNVLREILDAKFDDGSSIIEYILLDNPALARRLKEAFGL